MALCVSGASPSLSFPTLVPAVWFACVPVSCGTDRQVYFSLSTVFYVRDFIAFKQFAQVRPGATKLGFARVFRNAQLFGDFLVRIAIDGVHIEYDAIAGRK